MVRNIKEITINFSTQAKAADRLSLLFNASTARVQLGTNMLKLTVNFGRY